MDRYNDVSLRHNNQKMIDDIIRNRRAVFPAQYIDKEIPQAELEQILENANWAPTHKKTQPWRFKIYRGAALARLGDFLADWYKANTPTDQFKEIKYNKTKNKARQSACMIAICMEPDPSLPEWEEVAATACAVQNMWLSCTARNIGCYWSSPKSIHDFGDFHDLAGGERCLGFFYMGYFQGPLPLGVRSPMSEKVEWVDK